MQKTYKFKLSVFLGILCLFLGTSLSAQSLIYDNGPYYNAVGTGAGGANESALYTTTFGMGTIGFGHQNNTFNRVADDFTITDCYWRIDSIVFFGYQTGSTTTSTFTSYNFRIWDSVPDAPGSNVVFGDTITNRLINTSWSGAYRITETTSGNSTRPIMRNVCTAEGKYLPAATYWIDWSTTGSLASGPWACPITPPGVSVTGNAKQRIGSIWNNALDGGTGTPAQGFPFIIYGTTINLAADAGLNNLTCVGANVMLGGTPAATGGQGAITYAWSPSGVIIDTTVANPTFTVNDSMTFFLTVTDTLGCVGMDTVVVDTMSFQASISVIGDTVFCAGDSAQLTANNSLGYTYLWNTTSSDSSITVYNGGSYDVNVSNGMGCQSMASVNITVNALPVVIISSLGLTAVECEGSLDTLVATGADSYTWNTLETNDTIAVVQTSGLTSWTVIGTDLNGCSDTTETTISNVSALPSVTISSLDLTSVECEGSLDTLVATGADSYTWNTLENNDTIAVVQTSGLTSWTVIGTDLNGCSDTTEITISNVSTLLTVALDLTAIDTNCVNASAFPLATASPSGGTWSGTGVTGSDFDPATAGVGTHYLTYTVMNSDNCVSSATDSIFVSGCVGLEKYSAQASLIAFPNPSTGTFTIQNTNDASFVLVNELGQTISTIVLNSNNNYSYTFTNLDNGIYFIKGMSNGNLVTKKIVVTK